MAPADPAVDPPADYRDRFEALTGQSLRECPHCRHRHHGGDRLRRTARELPAGARYIMTPNRGRHSVKPNRPRHRGADAWATCAIPIANARPNRSDPGPVDRSPASLPSQMLPIYRPQRLERAHFRYQRGPLNAHSLRWGPRLSPTRFSLTGADPGRKPSRTDRAPRRQAKNALHYPTLSGFDRTRRSTAQDGWARHSLLAPQASKSALNS